jgi:4-hydroxy-2-oxoheptanedioate aldolase
MPDHDIHRNHFKQALAKGERQVGMWCGLANPLAAEILAGAGFDWILIDGEHAPNDIPLLLAQLQAMRGGTAEPVFRVPWNDFVIIKRTLDVGARTIVIPYVQSVEEAQRAVAATRYPPQGVRGVAGQVRAADFGRIKDYLKTAHLDICVIVQLETKAGLAAIEGIGAIEGIDGMFIGPNDLAADFGQVGNIGHPEVQAAIKDAAKRIRATGRAAGTLAFSSDDVERQFDMGFNFTAVGTDVGILARGAEGLAARFKKS